jgi:FtsP/CotA-like multicopper oxidase with cupredoxin domain
MVPVRVKFYNLLPTGAGGDLFLPVDTTAMGAGTGPLGGDEMYTENRAAVHLHGGDSVWISDGTPNQWITPAGETTSYPVGVSAINVPDMADPGDGAMTFYYTNAQGARLMFYHDHALAITRLNVYAGEAAAYLITDQVEKDLINGTNVSGVNPTNGAFLPDIGIPLVIQDRGFVDANTIAAQDPTWNAGTTPPVPNTGDLWYPHVYMPAQNPWDPTGANQFGRWHYAAWFWPPATDLMYPPIPNPYYDPIGAPWEPPEMPATPNPSMVGEAFMDTPVINGAAYPYLEVQPQAYRFRILNAANDRFWNLQLYETGLTVHLVNGGSGYSATPSVAFSGGGATADATATAVVTDGVITDITITDPGAGYTSAPTVTITDATGAGAIAVAALNTEVKMVAAPDGREGGVPDPMTAGPDWIQIGTEGGFLPAPAVVPTQPVTWNLDPTTFNFGNVENHSLLLGPAERADVIVDFSAFAGKTLLVYNDAPAAFPALDSRYDYYTGNPDQTDTGGAPTTQPGYGPNIRTIMQIRVADTAPAAAYDLAALQTVWAKTDVKPGVFESCQNQIIMPQADYNSAYNATFPGDPAGAYVLQFEFSKTFTPIGAAAPVTIPLEPKAIQDEMGEAYDIEYGRMSGLLGLELPVSQAGAQNFMLYPFMSPPVEIIRGSVFGTPIGSMSDGTQIWKITHNGVDTHTIHVHLFNAQLVNRVAWDGALIPPDPNELGWKETFRVNPLEHTILALRPILPNVPFQVPNSVRPIDPTRPVGAMLMAPLGGFKDPLGNGVMIMNHLVNFGAEYMEHCHLLAHEEMDMMHAIVIADTPVAPSSLDAELKGNTGTLTWTDNALNETGFLVQRAVAATGPWTDIGSAPAAAETGSTVTFQDPDTLDKKTTYYYQVMASNVVGDVDTPGFPTMTANSEAATAMLGSGNAAPPAIDSFTATPATINAGESATLTWQTTGATSVAINQGMGSQPVNGSMAVSPSATMTYTLTATGPSGTTTATATVTVTPPVGNIPPVAVNDTAATIKNTAVTFSVITNDYDPDGTIDPATVSVSATQKGGTVVSNGDGTVTFTPKDNVGGGSDTFTYTVQDNGTPPAVSNTATVTVNISNK